MMVFPSMLVPAAQSAGMKAPTEKEMDKFEKNWNNQKMKEKYPHFWVFCTLQLARPVRWGEHWENAKVIAGIPEEKLKTMTLSDFIAAGLEYHNAPMLD